MTNPIPNAEETSLAALAGELRISLGKLVRRLREQTPPNDFTSAQKSVLLRLDRDGLATVSALAGAESVRPQSMRSTVAALQALGAVMGVADSVDGRQTLITLTDAFRQRLQAHRSAKNDWLHGALEMQLSAAEQAQLAAAVRLLQRLADY
ncbi:MarR family winged helix-turn-helix transcriptional regulator [Sodalis sp.]|uniref:MarR family winged helix-turn-helix transcriptional regulator n=1 Tax=Sodalis sp. (in: enterobacteria) TaxID=1898979 RepID=UPI0038730070